MSSKSLKGLTIKFGGDTSDLYDSLNRVEKKGRSLSGELGHINRALKLDPGNTELVAQKQQVLAAAVANAEEKLNTLREAEKQVQEQFERGEASQEQVRALRREIIETTFRIDRYKKAADELAGAEEEVADGADKAAKKVDEQADKTRKAESAADDMNDAASDLAGGGLAAMTTAAAACLATIVAMAEESREYRTEMSKLNTAFKSANHQVSTATNTYKTLQSVIGETDQAVEAAQQIALLADSEKDAAEWADLAAGVIGRLGNALQPEVFYESANETLKLNAATGGYVQLLEQCGASVEEFNLGLAACTTEQEKQEYMLNTTRQLLGAAADQYRLANAEIIRSNEATERWNAATARIGAATEPAVTDLKELGATLLDDVASPLEDAAGFVRNDVIPAIRNFSTDVRNNMPVIKAVAVGVATAFVALKVATVANTVSQIGLAAAIKKTAAAQAALNLVQSATPWGLVAVAVTGVTAAIAAYSIAAKDAQKPIDVLTAEERELLCAAEETANAFREQRAATRETFDQINTEMKNVQMLSEELRDLADESGRVKEVDEARAKFIINELNNALGTEYEMIGGVIQQYDLLKNSVDELIASKTASLMIESYGDDYVTAIHNQSQAEGARDAARKELDAAAAALQEANDALALAVENYGNGVTTADIEKLNEDVEAAQEVCDTALEQFNNTDAECAQIEETIARYQAAQMAFAQGSYQLASDLLISYDGIYEHYANLPTDVAAKLIVLQANAAAMKAEAEKTKSGFELGMEGYTQEMVDEAQAGYEAAFEQFQNAYLDAYGVGEDIGDGLAAGMAAKEEGLAAQALKLVDEAMLAAMRKGLDSHSPSKKTEKIAEDAGDGLIIGTRNKTAEIKKAHHDQAITLLDAYREQEIKIQRTLIGIADQQAARQTSNQMAAASASTPMLERILTAIENGQVIALNDGTLVGATVGKMDSAMGRRRVMVKRGAIK